MQLYPDDILSPESLPSELGGDFAGCSDSLTALRRRVLAAAHRASVKRRTRLAVLRLAVLLVCSGLSAMHLSELARPDHWLQGREMERRTAKSEWDLVESLVGINSRRSQVLAGHDLSGRRRRPEPVSG